MNIKVTFHPNMQGLERAFRKNEQLKNKYLKMLQGTKEDVFRAQLTQSIKNCDKEIQRIKNQMEVLERKQQETKKKPISTDEKKQQTSAAGTPDRKESATIIREQKVQKLPGWGVVGSMVPWGLAKHLKPAQERQQYIQSVILESIGENQNVFFDLKELKQNPNLRNKITEEEFAKSIETLKTHYNIRCDRDGGICMISEEKLGEIREQKSRRMEQIRTKAHAFYRHYETKCPDTVLTLSEFCVISKLCDEKDVQLAVKAFEELEKEGKVALRQGQKPHTLGIKFLCQTEKTKEPPVGWLGWVFSPRQTPKVTHFTKKDEALLDLKQAHYITLKQIHQLEQAVKIMRQKQIEDIREQVEGKNKAEEKNIKEKILRGAKFKNEVKGIRMRKKAYANAYNQLFNLEALITTLQTQNNQAQLRKAMEKANETLKKNSLDIEKVKQLRDDIDEQVRDVNSIDESLALNLDDELEVDVDDDLELNREVEQRQEDSIGVDVDDDVDAQLQKIEEKLEEEQRVAAGSRQVVVN